MTSGCLEQVQDRSQDESIESNIGCTPLIRLRRVAHDLPAGVEVLVKAEHLNPGGSVKDRAALAMIVDGEKSGKLRPGMTILDATSGNTGIAYAMLGAERGYPVTLCLPKNASSERKRILTIYGANIIETDVQYGTDGAQSVARELATREPRKYFYPDQYNNDANWRAHYEGTGQEIWDQTEGLVTHFVAGLGTCGTFVGVTRRLKEHNLNVRAVAVQPDSPLHGLEGIKHMPTASVPGIYDPTLADETLEISTEEAQNMARGLARAEGLLVGPSSGANISAALRVAQSLPRPSVVITIICDGGEKYLSEYFWQRLLK